MRIGVQSARWYEESDPDGSFAYIRSLGFDAVDFNIDHYVPVGNMKKSETLLPTVFDGTVEEVLAYFTPLKEAAEKHGVAFSQMHAPFPVWVENRPDVTDYIFMAMEKILALCEYVHCPAIVVHSVKYPDKAKEIEINMEVYRRLIPAAKKYGVKICLENLFKSVNGVLYDGPCADAEEACWYIDTLNEEAGEEIFGFCFDVGHAILMRRSPKEYVEKMGKRLTVLHLHENNGSYDSHMLPYSHVVHSAGCLCDWEGLLAGLRNIGYDGALSFETFRVLGAYPKPLFTDALRFIHAIGAYWAQRIEEE